MPISKIARVLLASQSLAADTSVNVTEWNLSASYGGMLTVKLSNGAPGPTSVPVINVFIGEVSQTKRLFYTNTGDTADNSVKDFCIEIPQTAMFVNCTITNGSSNPITVEVFSQEVTTV